MGDYLMAEQTEHFGSLPPITANITGAVVTSDEWDQHLTPDRRRHFDSIGVEGVQFDVSNHCYSAAEKHFAALAWLREKRLEMERIAADRHAEQMQLQGDTYNMAFVAAYLTGFGIIVAIIVAVST
jgi:hypothetical protein